MTSITLRGPSTGAFLRRLDIDPTRYWLLMDLFATLSTRGEKVDQMGRSRKAMKFAAILFGVISALMAIGMVIASVPLGTWIAAFLGLTSFLLFSTLLLEAGNSLINPTEGMVLAHQPINGATYIAAKLSHLVRIVLVYVLTINTVPAFLRLIVPGTPWYYPLLHLMVALLLGMTIGLTCCAIYGWLVRFVPVKRLKGAGQFIGMLPFFASMGRRPIALMFLFVVNGVRHYLSPAAVWGLAILLTIMLLASIGFGLRSLSADYLIRVSSFTRSGGSVGAGVGARRRRSWLAGVIHKWFGGQTAVAGFAYTSRMMLRDWQFRRQLLPSLVYPVLGTGAVITKGWPPDPFSGNFTVAHLLPHLLGFLLFFACTLMPFGNDFRGRWVFAIAPSRAMLGFARGIHAMLWICVVLLPNLLLLPLFLWRWGVQDAVLFTAYSIAVVSFYLALEIRLVEAIPFSKQVNTTRQAMALPFMLGGMVVAGIAVALQYFLLFHSVVAVLAVTLVIAVGAWFLTRKSLADFTDSMRFNINAAATDVAG